MRFPKRLDRARLTNAATQSIANATVTGLVFGTTQYDTNSLKSGNTLVARRAGVYQLWGQVWWDNNATGLRLVIMRVNSVDICRIQGPSMSGDTFVQQLSCPAELVPGDVVFLDVYQASGGALLAITPCYLALTQISS